MSRYFGETGASVIAVEGSSLRAQIAAERCRDLPNVKVVCDNIIDYISDEKFDYVTLIASWNMHLSLFNQKIPLKHAWNVPDYSLKMMVA